MKSKTLNSAVAEAKQEQKRIAAQIVALTIQNEHLQDFIASGEKLTRKTKQSGSSPETPVQTIAANQTRQPFPINGHKREVWENIAESLRKVGHPMSPKQVVEAMEKFGTPVVGNFPRDNVRSTMNRKGDLFEKVGPGLFGLREWPTEIKHGKQAKAQ